ncbi:hypothetical protein Tco_0631739 [Tanacetum coccineum]
MSDRAMFPFVAYSWRFLRNNAINNLISLLFSRTTCFSLEEYHTAKTAFEAGCKLAPDDARFTYWITKCKKCIVTDNQEKDEKQSQNDKTGLGMEKTVKDKAKSKPESQSSQKVNRKVNWSKTKSTQVNSEAKVKKI